MNTLFVPQWRNSECESLQLTQAATGGTIKNVVLLGLKPWTFCV